MENYLVKNLPKTLPFYGLEFPDRLAEIRSGCFYGNN